MSKKTKTSIRQMNRTILNLSVPFIITSISIPLIGIVDMALMGHLEKDDYIGAIAIGSLIFNFIYWSLGFLRMGTTGFTAQAWGKRDLPETIRTFGRALVIGMFIAFLLLVLQRPIEVLSFKIINGEPEVEKLAAEYFRIRIWAAPAALGQFALLGFFLGMQNARIPMTILITSNLINILFNVLFVKVWSYTSDGVAYGTLIAQYVGITIAFFFLLKYFRRLFKYWTMKMILRWDKMKKFLYVNRDIFIRTMCLVVVFSFFTANSASADAQSQEEKTILAVNSILMQFFMFFSFFIDGFAHASEALSGKFIGRRDRDSLIKSIRLLFAWGLGISVLFTLVYLLRGDFIFSLLTDNMQLIANSRPFFIYIILIPLFSFAAFTWDGIFIGATAGSEMRNAMIVATALFFLVFLLFQNSRGNHALWIAFLVFMFARSIVMTALARKAVFAHIN